MNIKITQSSKSFLNYLQVDGLSSSNFVDGHFSAPEINVFHSIYLLIFL